MTTAPGTVLTLLADSEARNNLERVAAAVGVRMVHSPSALSRRTWLAAQAVVLDENGARSCRQLGLPRRGAVVLLAAGQPQPSDWSAAVGIGAQQVLSLPADEPELIRLLSEADETTSGSGAQGRVIAVIGGRGGAGASVLSVALAQCAREALLIDLDPWSGGLDLLLGGETAAGLRWPDLVLQGGRLSWDALRDALPRHRGLSVLSAARHCHEMEAEPAESVVAAGRRGGVTVICDLPRRMTGAALCVIGIAELVVVSTTCDVRGALASAALVPVLRANNPNLGLVVRGPSPGGLRAQEIADAAGIPLLAAMRPDPMLSQRLEHGGLRLRRRSPLASAARQVLAVVDRNTVEAVA